VDDLHWADLSSTDLLSYAGLRCGSLPVIFLGTYRPSDLLLSRHPFREVKLELQARRLAKEIDLTSFRPQDVEAFIGLEFPSNCFPPRFGDSVWKQTEGVPLFVSDLLHHLNDTGLIACENCSWRLTCPLADIRNTLPDSVRGMVERKIGRLDVRLRALAEAASVQGAEFHSAVLSRVTGIDAAEVEAALEVLAQSHRLVRFEREDEFPDGTFTLRYAFSHALYQNTLFAGIRPTRRAALSADVAETLPSSSRRPRKTSRGFRPIVKPWTLPCEPSRTRKECREALACAGCFTGRCNSPEPGRRSRSTKTRFPTS
jgi:predicted ATPase